MANEPQQVPAPPAVPQFDMKPVKKVDGAQQFRKYKCNKGHSAWDGDKMTFVIDHQAYAVPCKECGILFFIRPGQVPGMENVEPIPEGWAKEVGIAVE